MLKGSLLHNRSWDLDEIHTHSSFYSCPSYLQDLKLKALEWSQLISHYKYMGIFPDAQGQVTPQFKVWSGRISNPSEILWLSLLPARMKKIESKMVLE